MVSAEWEQGRVKQLFTANHGNIPFRADDFVLASGSFFSRGLVATPDRIVEPVFGADTAYIPDRSQWYTLRFFDRQNYQAFGVRTDRSLRVLREGAAVANLYCVGAGPGRVPPRTGGMRSRSLPALGPLCSRSDP